MIDPIIYPSKVLLLGEYGAISGEATMAVPWDYYSGQWEDENPNLDSLQSLKDFMHYFESREDDILFLKAWEEDLEDKVYFKSNIPHGYGIGSSGALVAAVFERYGNETGVNIEELRETFIIMESYFHGTSSGIDPLVSYLKQGILMQNGTARLFDYEDINILSHIYLWDTGIPRQTSPLVAWYKQQLENDAFKHAVQEIFFNANSIAMSALLADDAEAWEEQLEVISEFQRIHFTPMIPDGIREQWDIIAKEPGVQIKLCGAGGGGFYLLYAKEKSNIEHISQKLEGNIYQYRS